MFDPQLQQDVLRVGGRSSEIRLRAAMVDRLVQHAEVIVLKGDSYRLKNKTKEVMCSADR
jgi:DNA replication protein DnaC